MSDESSGAAVASASREWWRPTATIARFLEWILVAAAAGQVLLLFGAESAVPYVRMHRAFRALLDGHDATAQHLFGHLYDGVDRGWVQFATYVGWAVTVLLMVWTYRSATNARALGRTGARLGPVWAIVGWLIPFASYVLPYLVVQDLWRSSDPAAERGSTWRRLPGSALVRSWWAVHAAGSLATGFAVGLAAGGAWNASTTETALGVGRALSALGWVLTIFVVREITARQAAQQLADPAPTSRPLAARPALVGATVDGPGWYADSGGRYDHRYWDGTAWTEHVSTAGQPTTAPVIPPDWYPDPTGAFHWRYWTGHDWTEHVSRDGQLFIAPLPERDGG
ncbi:MAG TPA: DUF4328 domain-containing protein [Acidimicrobiia bacterium]